MSLTSHSPPPIVETSPLDAHHLEHRHDLSTLIDRASARVRHHPLPSLAGAAALGAAVTYVICNRNCQSWRAEAESHADSIVDTIHRALASMKLW
ncbi:MAG: hypothetical protein WED15_00530 [Akkermansiaceae bacterium]